MTAERYFAFCAACCLLGCVDLPYVAPGVCGNGVTEAPEQCDSYANRDLGQRCRAPGMAGECRYDCSEVIDLQAGEKAHCPDGFSCGVDGICHKSTGRYSAWGDALPQQTHSLQMGDLDGDGRAELLALGNPNARWGSELRILFFDENGAPTKLFDPHTVFSSPALSRPIVDDKLRVTRQRTVVAGTQFGVATLTANAAQVISAIPNPFQTVPTGWSYRLVRIHGVANNPLHEEVLLYLSGFNQAWLRATSWDMVVGTLGRPVEELSGDPVAGDVITAANSSPCDELVLNFRGDSNVYMQAVCDKSGYLLASTQTPNPVASLPAGHTIANQAQLARIDGDSTIDLLVADERGCPYVAFGLGDGSFVADPNNPVLTSGQLWPVVTPSSGCPEAASLSGEDYPLAIGDLNGQGLADWVFPKGIALVDGLIVDAANQRVRLDTYPGNGPYQWTLARIADLNRDGTPDLVAGSSLASDMDFLLGTGTDRLNRTTIKTDAPVQHVVTGDYDGDGTADIAFVQHFPLESTNLVDPDSGLAIAFGVPFGTPSPPMSVAEFGATQQLISANYKTDDSIEELGVLAQTTDSSALELTMFVGNAGRHPISSLGLWKGNDSADSQAAVSSAFASSVRAVPIATAVGQFPSDDGKAVFQGILALAKDDCVEASCYVRLWFVPGKGSGGLGIPAYSEAPLAPGAILANPSTGEPSVCFVVGQLNANLPGGPDDALLLTAGPEPSMVSLWRVALPLPKDSPIALMGDPAAGMLTSLSSPTLVDLDRDGWSDLVLLLADPTGEQHLNVVWNEAGSLDLSQARAVDVLGQTVRGLAAGSTTEPGKLFVVTRSSVCTLAWNAQRQVTILPVAYPTTAEGDLPGGDSIAVGDITGDGLPDLVVSTATSLHIYQEASTSP
jgi:hypothetical protein